MLCRNFELIPIKIRFFYEFWKLLKNRVKDPVLKLIKNLKKTRLSRIHLVLNHQKGITNKGQ